MELVGGEAPASIQCSTPAGKRPRLALKLFRGERDISGFDRPFTPIHRSSPSFQPRWVRPSTGSYPRFSLPTDSSPGFASTARDCSPGWDSLSLRLASWLNLATHRNSLAHSTKGTPSRARGPLRLLVGKRFQVLFHSPPGVLFTFPSRYWSTIGHRRVFRIGGWTPQLPTGFHVSGGTQEPLDGPRGFAYGALTLYRRPSHAVPLQRGFVTAQ